MKNYANDVKAKINLFLITQLREKLKNILQKSPLYTNNSIEFPEFDKAMSILGISDEIPEPDQTELRQYYDSIPIMNWNVVNQYEARGGYLIPQESRISRAPFINIVFPQTLSLFCSKCNSVEAFNFDNASDLIGYDLHNLCDPNIQIFSISYQCQMCKNLPEVFLIRRKNLKISIDGRSPIQSVDVNRDLPKNQRKYIRKAIVAYNSGEILAALFFQRTFLEQYVREVTGDRETRELDKIFETYKTLLGDEFNSMFPSLGAIYDRLSVVLHSADPSIETYFSVNEDIEIYFSALRAYKRQRKITW